jgi:hypothetical protein
MATRITTKRRATYQDILALPEHLTGEIVDGELYSQSRLFPAQGFAAQRISAQLLGPFDLGRGGLGGWWFLPGPEYHLREDIIVPDIAGWRRGRMPQIPSQPAIQVAPDWVCEILSPSTRRKDRIIKMPAYARHGVKWIWLVDPLAREVEVFEARDGGWFPAGTFGDVDRAPVPPFVGVEFDLSLLWPPDASQPD